MPELVIIYAESDQGQTIEDLSSSGYQKGLEAARLASEHDGIPIDESTLRIEDVTRDAVLNFGSDDDPVDVDLKKHGLVAVRWVVQSLTENEA